MIPDFLRFTLAVTLSAAVAVSPTLSEDHLHGSANRLAMGAETPVLRMAQADVAADYSWSARKAETGAVTISGEVPSLQTGKALRLAAGENVVDVASVRPGAPSDFEAMAMAGLSVLKELPFGEVELSKGMWHLRGKTDDPQAAVRVQAAMRSHGVSAKGWDLAVSMPEASDVRRVTADGQKKPAQDTAEAPDDANAADSGDNEKTPASTLPEVETYTWFAEKTADGSVKFGGYVPAEALQSYQRMRAGDAAVDETRLAAGAPESFIRHVMTGLDVLGQLTEGKVSLQPEGWSASGVAKSAEALAVAQAAVDAGQDWTSSIRPPAPSAISPYQWSVEKTGDGRLSMTGHVPTLPLKRYLDARAGREVSDRTDVGAGAPDGFIGDSIAAVDVLAALESGTVQFDGRHWRLTGRAKDTGQADAAVALLEKADTPAAEWDVSIATPPEESAQTSEDKSDGQSASAVDSGADQPSQTESVAQESNTQASTSSAAMNQSGMSGKEQASAGAAGGGEPSATGVAQPKEPDMATDEANPKADLGVTAEQTEAAQQSAVMDYPFSAVLQTGGKPVLSGYAPTDPAARYLAVIATGNSDNALEIRRDAPSHFITNATAGLRALTEMERGKLAYSDGNWVLTGTAANAEMRKQVEDLIAAVPDGTQWRVNVSSPPPLEICRAHVEQLAARNAILFNSGSDRLTEGSRSAIDELAVYLQECPKATIEVEGHTDSDGDEASNLALSVDRAEAVRDALIERGVSPERLYAIGYGESLPIASNDTRQGKQRNRRIAFKVLEHPEDVQQ